MLITKISLPHEPGGTTDFIALMSGIVIMSAVGYMIFKISKTNSLIKKSENNERNS